MSRPINSSTAWRWMLGTMIVCATATTWADARPPEPWPGPEGPYVFVEAEDFTIEGEGWETIGIARGREPYTPSGLEALSGAGEGDGRATNTIEVPEAGKYQLWLHHTYWPQDDENMRAPFVVTIAQNEHIIFERHYDDELTEEPESGRVHWAPYRWEHDAVELAAGEATVTIRKAEPLRTRHRTLRAVDCLLLTMDHDYEPDYRDFGLQTYVRFRLHDVEPDRIYFYTFFNYMRPTWYRNSRFAADGVADGVSAPTNLYLEAGDQTPWVNLTRRLYPDVDVNVTAVATVRYRNPDASESSFSIDFATAPDESAIAKTVTRNGSGAGMRVRIGPDLDVRLPRADIDFAQETAKVIERLPAVNFGRLSEQYPLIAGLSLDPTIHSPDTLETELDAFTHMGLNGITGIPTDAHRDANVRFGRAGGSIWHMGPSGFNDPNIERMRERLESTGVELHANPHHGDLIMAKLMDEAKAQSLTQMVGDEIDEAKFLDWLKAIDLTPSDLGVTEWDDVSLTADRDAPQPALYYYSQRFRAWSVANFFSIATQLVREHYPENIRSTQNFSDGAVYHANMYSQGNDYYQWYRHEVPDAPRLDVPALDLAMTEDWTNLGSTGQLTAWNVALKRSATRPLNQPIHMYVITSYGRGAAEIKLKSLSNIAQGSKSLNFFSYSPLYAGHEPGWYRRFEQHAALTELTREIGAAEHVLMDAMPTGTEVAMLYSVPYDIWNVGYDNADGHARMQTFLALLHAQVPVDVLGDDDAIAGDLDAYKVVYLYGEQIDRRLVEPLTAWVKAGGHLVLGPAGGTRDRFNQPIDVLDQALGLERGELEVLQRLWHSSIYHARVLRDQGNVTLLDETGEPAGESRLLARRQVVQPGDSGRVLARFDDDSPATVELPVGEGRVTLLGFHPSLSYLQQARQAYENGQDEQLIEPSSHVAAALEAAAEALDEPIRTPVQIEFGRYWRTPNAYPAADRQFIIAPADRAEVYWPVHVNEPLIEATFMTGEVGWVIPLANWSAQTHDRIEVRIAPDPDRAFGEIHSSRQGRLETTANGDGSVTVTLPLETTDFLFAQWQ